MGATIGKYRIVEELGRGGMGVVYKAWDEGLQRHVAIKVLANPISKDATVAARFLREARAVADLNHPNLVQVFDVDTYQDQPYFVMEFLDGESLAHVIEREGRLSVQRSVRILVDAAQGLAAVHEKGVVHRDIKPANIMLMAGGGVKVVDFGIARVEGAANSLTGTGMALGTPSYLSPEVCMAEKVDQRSDIFALGVVFFEMLTGEVPFQGDSPLEQMTQVVECKVPDIKALNPNVDEGIRVILAHMVAREPDQRYSDCTGLGADLQAYLLGQTPRYAASAASAVGARDTRPVAAPQEMDSVPTLIDQASRDTNTQLLQDTVPQAGQLAKSSRTLSVVEHPRRRSAWPMLAALAGVVVLAVGYWWAIQGRTLGSGSARIAQENTSVNPSPLAPGHAAVAAVEGGSPVDRPVLDATPRQNPDVVDAAGAHAVPVAASVAVAAGALVQPGAPAQAASQGVAEVAVGVDQSATPGPAVGGIARNSTEKKADAWDRAHPRVLVAGFGDPAIAGPLESYLEGALNPAGFSLVDEDFLPNGGLFSGPRPAQPIRLARAALQGGADLAILFEVIPVGEQDLHYYGRTSALRTAALTLRIVSLHEHRPLGAAMRGDVHYAALNATAKAQQLGQRIAPRVLERIRRFTGSARQ